MSVRISDEIISNEKLNHLYDTLSYLHGTNSNCIMVNYKSLSCSLDLFTFSNPKCDVIKMMFAYLKNQTAIFKDGGLLSALVAVDLIRRYKILNVPLPVVMGTNDEVITEIERLTDQLSIDFDIGKLKDVSVVIKTILTSKLSLTHCELEHLNILLACAFTNHNPLQNTHVILNHAGGVIESRLHDGLLLRLDRYFTEKKTLYKKNNNKKFRIILVSVALAMDSEELFSENGKAKIITDSIDRLKESVLQQIIEIGKVLSKCTDIVICQKVVHPTVKRLLKLNNVLCVDRVGGNIMPLLAKRCNCDVVSSLVLPDIDSYVSVIYDIEIIESGANFYLKMNSQLSSLAQVKTLMLFGKNEDEVNTLHRCFETCMIALSSLSRNSKVVCGGGCMQTQLSFHLCKLKQKSVGTNIDVIIKSLLSTSMAVASCELTALCHSVDNMFFHHWINADDVSGCCCGAVKKQDGIQFINFLELLNSQSWKTFPVNETTEIVSGTPSIVHVRDVFIHNLRSAFELANLVLRIGIKILPN